MKKNASDFHFPSYTCRPNHAAIPPALHSWSTAAKTPPTPSARRAQKTTPPLSEDAETAKPQHVENSATSASNRSTRLPPEPRTRVPHHRMSQRTQMHANLVRPPVSILTSSSVNLPNSIPSAAHPVMRDGLAPAFPTASSSARAARYPG